MYPLLALLLVLSASASDLDVRITAVDGLAGTRARVDFGLVSAVGAPPRTGRRVQAPDGGVHLVTPIVVEIVDAPEEDALRVRREAVRAAELRRPGTGARRAPRYVPAADPARDLYARLVRPPPRGTSVRLGPRGAVDWGAGATEGMEVGLLDQLVASGVRAGDRLPFEVSLFAADDLLGSVEAEIVFTLRGPPLPEIGRAPRRAPAPR